MKLTREEQIVFDKIKAISRRDKKVLKDVFISLLEAVTIETYLSQDNSFMFHIPYLCSLRIEYKDKIKYTAEGNKKGEYTDISITAVASESFIAEIEALSSGETPPSEKYIKKQIAEKFASLLDIQDVEIDS